MTAMFIPGAPGLVLGKDHLPQLKEMAKTSPLRRARYCFHQNHTDGVHEMVIAFCGDSYVSPHRHHQKSESFHVIEGELTVVFFNDKGEVIARLTMGSPTSGKPFFYRLNSDLWHTVVPRSEFVVIHETTKGPFVQGETDYAPFAPPESDKAACQAFVEQALVAPIRPEGVTLMTPTGGWVE